MAGLGGRARVPAKRSNKKRVKERRPEEEYVLEEKPPPPTLGKLPPSPFHWHPFTPLLLIQISFFPGIATIPPSAQRYGLAEAAPSVLSEGEWAAVKAQASARGDNSAPCVICKEDFGLCGQVLLSCSHVFHKVSSYLSQPYSCELSLNN